MATYTVVPGAAGNNNQFRGNGVGAIDQIASNVTLPTPARGTNLRVYRVGIKVGGASGENGRVAAGLWTSAGSLVCASSATTVGGTSNSNNLDTVIFDVNNATFTAGSSILFGFWREDGNSSYTTSWSFDDSISGYTIWYDNAATNIGTFTKDTTAYTSASLLGEIRYFYDPAPATAVSATAGVGSATISWTAPSDFGDSTGSSYYVQYCTDNVSWNFSSASVGSGVRSLSVSGLGNGATWYFRVVSVANSTLTSVSSSVSAVTPNVPGTPSVTATAGIRQITVTFTEPANNGSAISSYNYSLDNATWSGAISSGHVITGLANGTAYTVYVRANNAVGSSGSGSASATTASLPSNPTSLTANASTFGVVGLSWTASNGNGYGVTYTVKRGGTTLGTTTSTTYNDTTVAPSTAYTYTVTASTDVGSSGDASVSVTSLGGIVRVWNGTNWTTQVALVKVWNGSAWTLAQARVWNGTEWKYGI